MASLCDRQNLRLGMKFWNTWDDLWIYGSQKELILSNTSGLGISRSSDSFAHNSFRISLVRFTFLDDFGWRGQWGFWTKGKIRLSNSSTSKRHDPVTGEIIAQPHCYQPEHLFKKCKEKARTPARKQELQQKRAFRVVLSGFILPPERRKSHPHQT